MRLTTEELPDISTHIAVDAAPTKPAMPPARCLDMLDLAALANGPGERFASDLWNAMLFEP
jgi:hypothetical protein